MSIKVSINIQNTLDQHLPATAPTVSTTTNVEVPALTGYAIFKFSKVDARINASRFYEMAYQPGLWSAHCLTFSWGRVDSQKLRRLEKTFDSQQEALKCMHHNIARRLKHGYSLSTTNVVSDAATCALSEESVA